VTSDDLYYPVQVGPAPGRHGRRRGEQRRAPGRDAENLTADERGVQVLRCGGADGGDDLAPSAVGVDDDGILEAELRLEPFLKVGVLYTPGGRVTTVRTTPMSLAWRSRRDTRA
jgi:hypothetical protein